MGRGFYWEDHGPEGSLDHAVLYGPETYMIAAAITLDRGIPELQEGCWRVISGEYYGLNLEEKDTSLSLEQIKKRVLIRLGQQLKEEQEKIEADLSNVRDMLYADEPDDPYA